MALAPNGRIYAVLFDRSIISIDPVSGASAPLFAVPSAPQGIGGIAVDGAGAVYVAGEAISDGQSSGQILKWTSSAGPSLLVPVGCQNGGCVPCRTCPSQAMAR